MQRQFSMSGDLAAITLRTLIWENLVTRRVAQQGCALSLQRLIQQGPWKSFDFVQATSKLIVEILGLDLIDEPTAVRIILDCGKDRNHDGELGLAWIRAIAKKLVTDYVFPDWFTTDQGEPIGEPEIGIEV